MSAPLHKQPAQVPNRQRHNEPSQRGAQQDQGRRTPRQELPYHRRKNHHAEAAHRGSYGIDTSHFSSADRTVKSGSLFLFFLFVLQQGGACRENSREGEKKSADSRATFFRDHAGKNTNRPAEEKAEGELIPLRFTQSRKIDANVQSHSPQQHEPKPKGNRQPQRHQSYRREQSRPIALHHQQTRAGGINEKRHSACNHRTRFGGGVNFSLGRNRQIKGGK